MPQHEAGKAEYFRRRRKNEDIGTLSAGNLIIATAAALIFSAGAASAAGYPFGSAAFPTVEQGTFEHCGCDNRQGIERYVQNLITDAQQRGATCDMSMHIPACIVSYCSICKEHPDLMESCMNAGMNYLTSSPGFCASQTGDAAAFAYAPF
jgi:hypothetical protein